MKDSEDQHAFLSRQQGRTRNRQEKFRGNMFREDWIPGRLLGRGGNDDGPKCIILPGEAPYIKEIVIPLGHSKSPCCLCVLSLHPIPLIRPHWLLGERSF